MTCVSVGTEADDIPLDRTDRRKGQGGKMRFLSPHLRRLSLSLLCCVAGFIITVIDVVKCGEPWPLERPDGMPSIQSLEVMCGKDHMDVHLTFSQAFEGIVSSKGQHADPRCVYVSPSTGRTFFSFRIAYTRCGTKPDPYGQFYENTVVVQYDKDLLEVWDEAKRLRCEWFNDYEKKATKPPMVIADLDVVQLDFRGDNVDCWMEIQHGKGPWAPPVSGIVPLGSILTLVVAINDYRGEFDMRVKSCIASDGGAHLIRLSDDFGCVLRPKMISQFVKARGADDRASVITYAFFHAFKFPDTLSVYIKCKVEICRHGCLDHCQLQPTSKGDPDLTHYVDAGEANPHERKDDSVATAAEEDAKAADYPDVIQTGEGGTAIKSNFPTIRLNEEDERRNDKNAEKKDATIAPQKEPYISLDKFPYGPRQFEESGAHAPIAAPRSLSDDVPKTQESPKTKKKRRSIVVSDRKSDVGVTSLYEVISEADLAFSPDTRAEAVTVFQGKIREEVVYGICMPVPGFSLLFIMVALSAVVSALVAGSLLYRYQLQREQMIEQARHNGFMAMSSFGNWMRLLKSRGVAPPSPAMDVSNGAVVTTAANGDIED